MERTLSDSQIRYIKARERRNLRGAQAFICLFLSPVSYTHLTLPTIYSV